jgi:S-adenosylmethionine hydrolase
LEKRIIALITDFGNSFYVGQVKGVIKSINPDAEIIDITHEVPKFNIKAGR